MYSSVKLTIFNISYPQWQARVFPCSVISSLRSPWLRSLRLRTLFLHATNYTGGLQLLEYNEERDHNGLDGMPPRRGPR